VRVRYNQNPHAIPRQKIAMTDYNICAGMPTVESLHLGKTRNDTARAGSGSHDQGGICRHARKCPPYCIQPMQLAPGVETLGELEVLDCLKRIRHGESGLNGHRFPHPGLVCEGTIPGAVNIPYAQNMAGLATDLPA